MEKKKSLTVHQDVYISLLSITAGIFLYAVSNQMNRQAAVFPKITLTVFLVLMIVVLFQGIKKSIAATKAKGQIDERMLKWEQNKVPYLVFLITILYVVLIKYIGFFISTAIFIPGLMLFFKQKSWTAIICITAGSLIFIYLLFVVLLRATFP